MHGPMESARHQRLKALSLAFLRSAGCVALATEVRCPASRYRADAAGFADPLVRGRAVEPAAPLRAPGRPTTVIVECKQSRADFLKDSRGLESLMARRRELDARRREMENRLIRASEPHLLASGTMLFPEMETWDFAASRSPTYRAIQRDLRRLDGQIHGDTKFWTIAHYSLADVLLIAAPRGMIRTRELPPGWGLIDVPPEWLDAPPEDGLYTESLAFRVRAPHRAAAAPTRLTREVHRIRLLRNIAVAACNAAAPPRLVTRVSVAAPNGQPPTRAAISA